MLNILPLVNIGKYVRKEMFFKTRLKDVNSTIKRITVSYMHYLLLPIISTVENGRKGDKPSVILLTTLYMHYYANEL